jgi:hypothetical protein
MRLHHKVALPSLRIAPVQRCGYPQIRAPPREPRRHDAHQSAWLAVQYKDPPQQLGIEIKLLRPQLVTQHEDGRCARLPILRRDAPAEQCRHSQGSEYVRRYIRSLETLRAFAAGIENVLVRIPHDVLKHMVLLLVVEKLRDGKRCAPATIAAFHVVNHDQNDPACILIRKRIEQHVIDHAENSSDRADSEG